MNYRDQLRRMLARDRWSLVEVVTDGDWWLDEEWRLTSNAEAFGLSLYLTFTVDPLWSGDRNPGQGVYEVVASREPLSDRQDSSTKVGSIFMGKRRFDEKLAEFREAISSFRASAST